LGVASSEHRFSDTLCRAPREPPCGDPFPPPISGRLMQWTCILTLRAPDPPVS
jgi:hypothetical protein